MRIYRERKRRPSIHSWIARKVSAFGVFFRWIHSDSLVFAARGLAGFKYAESWACIPLLVSSRRFRSFMNRSVRGVGFRGMRFS